VPNPGVVGSPIKLSGSASFHQDPSKSIDSWEWDFNNDGVFDASGPMVTVTFPALGTYPVKLRVTDDGSPEKSAETVVSVLITTPPVGPTASANGPYVFCPQTQPWFLDGTGSVNPDQGLGLPAAPGDTIQQYAWDLDGDRDFNDAFGSQPDVTAYFVGRGPGDYLISLRVTDTTSTSFPGLAPPFNTDLSDEDSAVVSVKAADDPQCGCVDDLAAISKLGKVQLNWTHTGAVSYNVYRGTISGGPYLGIANTTSTYSLYLDTNVVAGTTYYYVVRPAALNGNELCQSNEASVTVPTTRRR
jgi:PKD repeat protein